jgi:PAS domain S-box-containing protein
MTRRRLSLARFVAATLVMLTTLLLVALGAAAYRSEAKRQRQELDGLVKVQAREAAVALAVPVWNIDRPVIQQLLDAMAQPQSIYGISMTAAGGTVGRVRAADWHLVPWDGSKVPPGMIVVEREIVHGNDVVGVVRLYATTRGIERNLRRVLKELVVAIVLIDLLIIASVYLVLWRAVLRPLTEIERYAGAVSAGEQRSVALKAGSAAELESLRSSIESMVQLLALREARFRSIFESVNDAIFIIDSENGKVLDVNARVVEMFGYTPEEVRALDMGVLSSGAPPYTLQDAEARIGGLRPGDRQLFEWRARHKDGHLFWVEVSLRAATIGDAMRVVSVVRDIDERKAMQDALRRGETMSMMGSLVAGVAHEVRNPLFGIAATLDAFEAEFGGGESVSEYLATLRNDVSRLSRLMHDLLDYGRPQQAERRVQSIRPVVAEAIRVCAAGVKEKRIEIREEIADNLPSVSINADRMLQVLKNLIENAVEFSAPGETVQLRVREDENGAPALVCTVADRGPGFRHEDLPHVFEPFFTRRQGGSGLGLAIVQKIVADHGGTIAAKNAIDGGGIVEIRLPIHEPRRRNSSTRIQAPKDLAAS